MSQQLPKHISHKEALLLQKIPKYDIILIIALWRRTEKNERYSNRRIINSKALV